MVPPSVHFYTTEIAMNQQGCGIGTDDGTIDFVVVVVGVGRPAVWTMTSTSGIPGINVFDLEIAYEHSMDLLSLEVYCIYVEWTEL